MEVQGLFIAGFICWIISAHGRAGLVLGAGAGRYGI